MYLPLYKHINTVMETFVLDESQPNKTRRPWGYYCVLYEAEGVKVKELTVNPGQALSMQRHQDRAEHWFVAQGTATVYTLNQRTTDSELEGIYNTHEHVHIDRTQWHQLANEGTEPLKMIEIQYGANCIESDIERI